MPLTIHQRPHNALTPFAAVPLRVPPLAPLAPIEDAWIIGERAVRAVPANPIGAGRMEAALAALYPHDRHVGAARRLLDLVVDTVLARRPIEESDVVNVGERIALLTGPAPTRAELQLAARQIRTRRDFEKTLNTAEAAYFLQRFPEPKSISIGEGFAPLLDLGFLTSRVVTDVLAEDAALPPAIKEGIAAVRTQLHRTLGTSDTAPAYLNARAKIVGNPAGEVYGAVVTFEGRDDDALPASAGSPYLAVVALDSRGAPLGDVAVSVANGGFGTE